MLEEIWEPGLKVVFVGAVVDELSDALGFYSLSPGNRFWELLEIGGITPGRHITTSERKALTEGHARGNLSDPVRAMFIQKKISQLLRLGVGIATINRRVTPKNDKDKTAKPTDEDVRQFIVRATTQNPKILAFVITPELFVDLFGVRYPGVTAAPGVQPFSIGSADVWLLGSPAARLRGEVLTQQEDTFFALGERITGLGKESLGGG